MDLVAIDYRSTSAGIEAAGEPHVLATGEARFHVAFDALGDLWLVQWDIDRASVLDLP